MELHQNSIIRFIAQTFLLFAVDILTLMLLAALFGEDAKSISSMYQFGRQGLATTTMLQFLVSSATVVAIKNIFYSERIFHNMMALWRTVLTLFSILFVHILYIFLFDWFSFDNGYAWAGFILFFAGGCILGSAFMILKTKLESRQYDELLTQYKNMREEEE